jgi:tellurite resistance protein
MIDHHTALIYTMVLVSAADREMTDLELRTIGEMVNYLPVFRDYDSDRLIDDAKGCAKLLNESKGLDKVFVVIREALPPHLHETAYALACDVATADAMTTQEELRVLDLLRHSLKIDRLAAAAIERGAVARHRVA